MRFDRPADAAAAAVRIRGAGYTVVKDVGDAFQRLRYATSADPAGYMVNLFARN